MSQENQVIQEIYQWYIKARPELEGTIESVKGLNAQQHEIQSDISICLSAVNTTKEVESLLHRFKSIEDNVMSLRTVINDHVDNHDMKPQRNFGADIPKYPPRQDNRNIGVPPKWMNMNSTNWDEYAYMYGKDGSAGFHDWRPELADKLKEIHKDPKRKGTAIVDTGYQYVMAKWERPQNSGKWVEIVKRRKIAGFKNQESIEEPVLA